MTVGAEKFLNGANLAELWERIKRELNAKQDQNLATDAEVEEMLDEVFSAGEESLPGQETATETEIQEMLDEVFGASRVK